MSLSCDCQEWDGDGIYLTKFTLNDLENGMEEFFFPLNTKRGRKCASCSKHIKIGELCVEFERFIGCRSEVEYRIYGDEGRPLSSWFLCERCGEIHANLEDLGYCINIQDNMESLLEEYKQLAKGAK